jgi:hypothetical protein
VARTKSRRTAKPEMIERDVQFRFYRPIFENPSTTLDGLLMQLINLSDFDDRLVSRPLNSDVSTMIYRLHQTSDKKSLIFHVFKIKGDQKELLGDLQTRTFTRLKDSIVDFGQDKGILKHLIISYNINSRILAWQSSRSVSIEDVKSYLYEKFGTLLRLEPVINTKTDKIFDAMDTTEWSLDIRPSSAEDYVALFDLPQNQVPSVIADIYAQTRASSLKITVLSDPKNTEKKLNKELLKRERERWSLINLLKKNRVVMKANGNVDMNGKLETVFVDLINGLLTCNFPIRYNSQNIDELWREKEKVALQAIDYSDSIL